MSIFAIGDLHLSFASEKPMDIFGGQWTDHAEKLKDNWLRTVGPGDLVLIPGDISWALKPEEAETDLRWLAALPGAKLLLKGNHDLWWTSLKKLSALDERLVFLQNNCFEYDDYVICGSRGWICPDDADFGAHDEKIYEREQIRLRLSLDSAKKSRGKTIIAMMHFSPAIGGHSSAFTDIFEEYGVSQVVYGHLHGPEAHKRALGGPFRGVQYRLVSCDFVACQPVKIVE